MSNPNLETANTAEKFKQIPAVAIENLKNSQKYQEYEKIARDLPPSRSWKLDSLHFGSRKAIDAIKGIIAQNTPVKEKNIFQKTGSFISGIGSGIAQATRKISFDIKNGIIGRDIASSLNVGSEGRDTEVDTESKSNMAEMFGRSLNFIKDSIKGLDKVDPAKLPEVQASIDQVLEAYLQDQISYMHSLKQQAIAKMKEQGLSLSEEGIEAYIKEHNTELLQQTEQPDYNGRTSELNGLFKRKATQMASNMLVGSAITASGLFGAGIPIATALGGARGGIGAMVEGGRLKNLKMLELKKTKIEELAEVILEEGFKVKEELLNIVSNRDGKLDQEAFNMLKDSFNTIIVPRLNLMSPFLRAKFEEIQYLLTKIELDNKIIDTDPNSNKNKNIIDFAKVLNNTAANLFNQIDKKEEEGIYKQQAEAELKKTRNSRLAWGIAGGAVVGGGLAAIAWGIGNSVPDLEGVRRGLLKLFNQDTNTVIETDSAFGITSHSSPERIQEFIQKTGDTSPQQIGDMLVFAKDGGDVVVDEFMEEVRNKVVSTGISESLADLPDYNGLEGIKALDPDREAMFSEGVIRDGKYYGPGSSVVPGVDNQDEIFTIVGKGPNGELLVATSDASPEALASLQEQGVELWSAADTSNTSTTNLTPELTPEQAEQVIKSFDESTGIVNLQGLTPWDLRNLNLGQGGSVWGMLEDLGLTDKQIIEAINSGALQGPDGTSLPTDHLSRFYEELPPGYEVSININKLPEELRSGVLGIAKQLNDGNGPGGGGGEGGEVLKNALIGTVGGGAVGTITGGAIGGLKKGQEGAIEGARRGALYGSAAAAAGTAIGLGFIGTAMAKLVGGSAGGFLGGAAGGVVGGALVEGGKKDSEKKDLSPTEQQKDNELGNALNTEINATISKFNIDKEAWNKLSDKKSQASNYEKKMNAYIQDLQGVKNKAKAFNSPETKKAFTDYCDKAIKSLQDAKATIKGGNEITQDINVKPTDSKKADSGNPNPEEIDYNNEADFIQLENELSTRLKDIINEREKLAKEWKRIVAKSGKLNNLVKNKKGDYIDAFNNLKNALFQTVQELNSKIMPKLNASNQSKLKIKISSYKKAILDLESDIKSIENGKAILSSIAADIISPLELRAVKDLAEQGKEIIDNKSKDKRGAMQILDAISDSGKYNKLKYDNQPCIKKIEDLRKYVRDCAVVLGKENIPETNRNELLEQYYKSLEYITKLLNLKLQNEIDNVNKIDKKTKRKNKIEILAKAYTSLDVEEYHTLSQIINDSQKPYEKAILTWDEPYVESLNKVYNQVDKNKEELRRLIATEMGESDISAEDLADYIQ